MSKTIRFYNINWDTSDEECDSDRPDPTPAELGLPTEVTGVFDPDFDPVEDAADYLADQYGYRVYGCC